ncbi:MAG: transglycosylase domain-containing protein, partial [Candidatus Binataceae bacterium]
MAKAAAGGGRGKRRKRRRLRDIRIRGFKLSHIAAAAFLFVAFALGFYGAGLYAEISALIEQRRGALTSAIYSAPTVIRIGDDLDRLKLVDRLSHLSYAETTTVQRSGEYLRSKGALTLYTRAFKVGARSFPPAIARISLKGDRVTGIADAFGVARSSAFLEPEVIGRLLEGTPAERVEVPLRDVPPYLIGGLLAVEDNWFYYHAGFNPVRIVAAAINNLRARRLASGASTITQQLARTFMDRRERTFSRKFKELAVASVIELRLTKNAILERYINDVAMGDYAGTPIAGMPLAARYLFNKDLNKVTLHEAAVLIGMVRAPTYYDPRRNPARSQMRRDVVLHVMREAGVIDEAAYLAALRQPIAVAKASGLRRAPYFTDFVTNFVTHIPGFDGNLRGVKVFTTLDVQAQATAHDAVLRNLERLERERRGLRRAPAAEPLQSALVALDAQDGAVRAMVGGRDYAQSQFNRAALAHRQPGSAFKPITYVTALDPERAPFQPALTLASVLPDRPLAIGAWMPVNYDGVYKGDVTVAEAIIESRNVPAAYVGTLVRASNIVNTAHDLGIHDHLAPYPPIAIGAGEVTLLDLASAYQVFASGGVASPPYAVEAVVDGRGRVIYTHRDESRQVLRPPVAYVMTGVLQAVMKYGTGAGAQLMGVNFSAAGKTGTTNDYRDAYFVGYTPDVVCAVWVGFDQPRDTGLTGAQAALPAWADFMTEVASSTPRDFPEPVGIEMANIDPFTGGLATPGCPRAISLPFLVGTAPTQMCRLHGGGMYASMPTAPVSVSAEAPLSAAPVAEPVATPTPSSSD